MFSFIKKFQDSRRQKLYDEQKRQLATGEAKNWLVLARDEQTNPEILYYLAGKGDADVRRAVAHNKSTPLQAASLLAEDRDGDVRLLLAERLLKLLPSLTPERHSQIYAFTVQALGMLAQDEMLQIRRALTTSLSDYALAPPQVVVRLANDLAREVAEPILRFCVALKDEDLLDVISGYSAPWVVVAIANRDSVSPPVVDAVMGTGEAEATTALVKNPGARFSLEALQAIVERAKDHPEWHQPVAMRKELSSELARQMIGFVDKAVLDVLEKRSDFEPAARKQISEMVGRRLSYLHDMPEGETAEHRAIRYIKDGKMTQDVLADALAWHENDFVIFGLAHFAKVHPQIVKRMVETVTPKPLVALCWRAQLPMRFCTDLQQRLAKIPLKDVMYAKGGTEYPMTPDEIKWQLEFFGIAD
ncbi:MAG TPA: DUF2336 domain-containing protein [Alphaproteobacteria bacterium]|nr:DUF2336 domain-containing protein [Alphaproteobacteria bacterium]